MSYAIMGDLHLRFDQVPINRTKMFKMNIFDKISSVAKEMEQRKMNTLILTGDIIDIKDIRSYKEVTNIITALKMITNKGIKIYTIRGNHDSKIGSIPVYDLLIDLGIIHQLSEEPTSIDDEHMVYGIDFTEDLSTLKNDIFDLNKNIDKTKKNILVIHEHLIPELEPIFVKAEINYILYKEIGIIASNFNKVVGGHYHKPFPPTAVNGVQIINPSSFVRTKVNERFMPNIYFSDTDTQEDIKGAKDANEIFITLESNEEKPMDLTELIDSFKNYGSSESQKALADKLQELEMALSQEARDLMNQMATELHLN